MAFVSSSFFGAKLPFKPKSSHIRHDYTFCFSEVRASAKGPNWKPFIFRQEDNESNDHNYKPFDGSRPLLPPWRPPTIEAEFRYNAQRIISRESRAAAQKQPKKIVKIESASHGTLFAEVVQEIEPQSAPEKPNALKKLWLRPLLLDGEETYMDLRGGNDLFLDAAKVTDISSETRTRVTVNLAVAEGDLIDRAVADERWKEATSAALIAFMKSI